MFPAFPLSEYVTSFWFHEGAPEHARERVFPSANVQIVFNLHEDSFHFSKPGGAERFEHSQGALVAGPHSNFSIVDTTGMKSIMGVHFKPGGAWPFFDSPTNVLHDTHVPLNALWTGQTSELRERLTVEPDLESRFRLLENTLLEQLRRGVRRHPAVAFALQEFQSDQAACSVSEVVERVGLNSRQFIALFSKEVGLTPKLFCRLHRFQNSLRRLSSTKSVDWADLAVECRFF